MILMQYFFLIFLIKAFVVGTPLNYLNCCGIQMSTHSICFYKEVEKST